MYRIDVLGKDNSSLVEKVFIFCFSFVFKVIDYQVS